MADEVLESSSAHHIFAGGRWRPGQRPWPPTWLTASGDRPMLIVVEPDKACLLESPRGALAAIEPGSPTAWPV